MKKFILWPLLVSLVVLVGCSARDVEPVAEGPDYLFVVKGKARNDGTKLFVHSKEVEWFTEPPYHEAGTESAEELVDFLAASDGENKNGAIIGAGIDAIVEFTNAAYQDEMLVLSYKVIRGNVPEGDLGEITLFVDRCGCGTAGCPKKKCKK